MVWIVRVEEWSGGSIKNEEEQEGM